MHLIIATTFSIVSLSIEFADAGGEAPTSAQQCAVGNRALLNAHTMNALHLNCKNTIHETNWIKT